MQPKVSIVIPCYNKVNYIKGMFDSIIAQKWNNIEIILINDGSTDGTREIITDYEQKFIERGFEVIIIDQENKGLAAAVYEGLKLVTGEYFCQVDADDSLDQEYVSVLTGFLESNLGFEWVVCDALSKNINTPHYNYMSFFISDIPEYHNMKNLIDYYFLNKIAISAWRYIIRTTYLHKSKLLDYYVNYVRGMQERSFIIPLLLANGNLKHIPKPLYNYVQNETSISKFESYYCIINYYIVENEIALEVIKRLNIEIKQKKRLAILQKTNHYNMCYRFARQYDTDEDTKLINKEVLVFINNLFYPSPGFNNKDLEENNLLIFTAIIDNILKMNKIFNIPTDKNIVMWGVLGQNGRNYMKKVDKYKMKPNELWDINGDGVVIKKPDVNRLSSNDIVIVLPWGAIGREIVSEIKNTGCEVLNYEEIVMYEAMQRYPEFYDGSIKFKY
ncbi:MAG: glycosyltransferase [Oscillospiraceae bacterium]|jgi:glycosyltransferase involved in cell wall biosynthesis|nr:glycosyltransferase [Oscillospiraceae bacterium]